MNGETLSWDMYLPRFINTTSQATDCCFTHTHLHTQVITIKLSRSYPTVAKGLIASNSVTMRKRAPRKHQPDSDSGHDSPRAFVCAQCHAKIRGRTQWTRHKQRHCPFLEKPIRSQPKDEGLKYAMSPCDVKVTVTPKNDEASTTIRVRASFIRMRLCKAVDSE